METVTAQDAAALIDAAASQHIDLLQEFLRIPTPRMQEHRAIHFLADRFKQAGCEVVVFDGKGQGEPTPDGPPINVFARRPGKGGGRSLLLEAHVDVVPVGDPNRWTHGPWSGDIVDGKMYARGAHDDRTGAAIMFIIADLLSEMRAETEGDIYFLCTTEEEFSSGGMKAYVERPDRVYPDAHLMIDGNMAGKSIVAHAGAVNFEVHIGGSFGSSQFRHLTHEANAIEMASTLVTELKRYESEVGQKLKTLGTDPRWPAPIIAVSEISSNGWFSNVPETCTLRGYGNVIPPLTLPSYKTAFEEFVLEVSSKFEWFRNHPPVVRWGSIDVPPMSEAEDKAFFQLLSKSHQKYFGTELIGRYIGGWGDPRLLDCPNIIFYGPGGGGGDHTYDEYFVVSDLAPMIKTITNFIFDWSGTG